MQTRDHPALPEPPKAERWTLKDVCWVALIVGLFAAMLWAMGDWTDVSQAVWSYRWPFGLLIIFVTGGRLLADALSRWKGGRARRPGPALQAITDARDDAEPAPRPRLDAASQVMLLGYWITLPTWRLVQVVMVRDWPRVAVLTVIVGAIGYTMVRYAMVWLSTRPQTA